MGNLKSALLVSLLSVWVLVGLFCYLNRYTKRGYFAIWTGAWLFYALWLTLTLGLQSGDENPLLVMVKQWCLSAAAVSLLWGSARFLKVRTRQSVFGWFFAFLFVWSYVGAYHLEDPFQLQCPIFSLIGLASLQTSSCFYRFRRKCSYVGAGLLSFGFFFWGLYLISFPFLQNSDPLIGAGFFISAVLQLFIAVSMIVLVLEEVRTTHENDVQTLRSLNTEKDALQTKVLSTEERYRCLFDQASEGIVITDRTELKVLELNRTAERLLGLNRAEASDLALTSFVQLTVPPQPAPQTGAEWFDMIRQQRQMNLVRRDGSVTPSEPVCSQINFEGRPAYQFFFHELTERARLEQQLRQAEKLSALGRMISGVAHELNNPLAVIKGYLELVLLHHPLSERTRTDLEKVAHEGNRAAKLVSNFLSFAREHHACREQVDLNELAGRVAELRKFELLTCGVELQVDLDAHLPPTLADDDQLQQVLVNLVTNSLQAMADLPHPRHLRIRTHRVGELAQIMVEDNGPGVPDPLLAKIFEPFFTTKEVGTGTGLGLSIAHSIMADHHGRIVYRHSSLGGAAFVLELPLVEMEVEEGQAPGVAGKEDPLENTVSATAAQILVLDDEEQLAEMLAEFVTMLGHTPTICHTAHRALELIEKSNFDLILSDFRMPGINGKQFYQIVAARNPELARRIVFLTGDLVNEETRRFLESTGNPHLGKPFNLASVQQIVAKYLPVNGSHIAVAAAGKSPAEFYETSFPASPLLRAQHV